MDQTHDISGQQLYRLTRRYQTPDFVKEANVETLCGTEDMPPDVYGDPVHRLFPCHSQAATWASMAFFLDKKASLNPKDIEVIEQRLLQFADYHGIRNAVNDLCQKASAASTDPTASLPDDDFALIFTEGVSKQRHFPLRNAKEVKVAAEYLFNNRDYFPYALRRDFADKVLQKAAQCNTTLDKYADYIERQAGHGACSTKVAVNFLRDRVKAAQKGPGPLTTIQKELLNLASTFESHPSRLREPGIRVKLAAVVDDYDKLTGIHRDYGQELLRPEDVLFELTREKMANVMEEHCATTTGNIYKLADIERIGIGDIRDNIGDDLADALKGVGPYVDSDKAAEIVPTMDRGLAELFDRLLVSRGVSPIAKEASTNSMGFSRNYLQSLAQEYVAHPEQYQ